MNEISNSEKADSVFSYIPKNKSIYEKLIPGKTKANARGSPMINNMIKDVSIYKFAHLKRMLIKTDVKRPAKAYVILILSNFPIILFRANDTALIKEIAQKVHFEIWGKLLQKYLIGRNINSIPIIPPIDNQKRYLKDLKNSLFMFETVFKISS